MSEAKQAALRARSVVSELAQASNELRNKALFSMAAALRENTDLILRANAQDCENARAKNTKDSLIDRLLLNADRIEAMASALEALAELRDPLDRTLEERTLYNGLRLRRVTVPLGVVAMVYEARPNVTADAAGICIKSGNTAVLRGGSLAIHSNNAIADILRTAVEKLDFQLTVLLRFSLPIVQKPMNCSHCMVLWMSLFPVVELALFNIV